MSLLEKFSKAGGILPPEETMLTREEYFNDPRFLIWTLDAFNPDLNVPDEDNGNTAIFHLISRRKNLYSSLVFSLKSVM